ncbi:hypothetical protein V1291_004493 [Nitrobacteraceae bacterium AZCC 1564]
MSRLRSSLQPIVPHRLVWWLRSSLRGVLHYEANFGFRTLASLAQRLLALGGGLLGMIAGPAGATTLVAAWTPTTTVIGADSFTHTLDDEKQWSKCKIRRAGPVLWTATGILGNPEFNFSLDRLVDEAMSRPERLDARIKAFEAALVVPLSEVVENIRVENPSWYVRRAKGLAVTRVIFSANEDGVNRFWTREFVAKSAPVGRWVNISVKRTDCPGPACQHRRVFLLGQYDYARKIADDAATWEQNGTAEAVRRAIEAEIENNPRHVGPPIAIAEMTKDGVKWIEKGLCGEK